MASLVKPTSIAATALLLILTGLAMPPVSAAAAAAPRRSGAGDRPGTPADARTLVRAKVTAVDPSTGRIEMTGAGLTLSAVFPPAVVADVKPDDVVFVTLDVIDTRVATVRGWIAAVDQTKGTAVVNTPGGTLTLSPSATALAGMKPGDEVLLKLNVVDIGNTDAPIKPRALLDPRLDQP
jgi:hypothetical protein